MNLIILRSGIICLCVASTPALSQDVIPQSSYAGAPDGQVEAFAGEWSAFRPGGEDRTLVVCGAPVTLTPASAGELEYKLYSGLPLDFEITSEDGRTIWTNPDEGNQVSVWVSKNQFHLHSLTENGVPNWSDIMVYYRCPDNPQQSYDGAIDGDAEPFIGTWSLAYRHHTGNHPHEILASCDVPIRIEGLEQNYILHDDPEGTSGNVTLSVHEGHTDWQFDHIDYPWEVVWITPNRFHAYLIGVFGDTNWRLPFIYERCD